MITITTLEQAVLKSIKVQGNGFLPQNLIINGSVEIQAKQVAAVVNNLIGKGLAVRSKDLFGSNVTLTRSGKIRATKLMAMAA